MSRSLSISVLVPPPPPLPPPLVPPPPPPVPNAGGCILGGSGSLDHLVCFTRRLAQETEFGIALMQRPGCPPVELFHRIVVVPLQQLRVRVVDASDDVEVVRNTHGVPRFFWVLWLFEGVVRFRMTAPSPGNASRYHPPGMSRRFMDPAEAQRDRWRFRGAC